MPNMAPSALSTTTGGASWVEVHGDCRRGIGSTKRCSGIARANERTAVARKFQKGQDARVSGHCHFCELSRRAMNSLPSRERLRSGARTQSATAGVIY